MITKQAVEKTKDRILDILIEMQRDILDIKNPVDIVNKALVKLSSLIDEEKGLERERWLGFFKEDIAHSFIPRCGGCGKIATEQTVKGKHAQESNERPCNWGYYCRKCFDEGLKIEEEAMYGR